MKKRKIKDRENILSPSSSSSFFKEKNKIKELETIISDFEIVYSSWINLLRNFMSVYAEHGKAYKGLFYNSLKPISDQVIDSFERFDNQHPDALMHMDKFANSNILNLGMSSKIKNIRFISQAINDFDIHQFIDQNSLIFDQKFLIETLDYLNNFYKNNTEILGEFKRIQNAARDFLSSLTLDPSEKNKKVILVSLKRLRNEFLNFKFKLVNHLELQEIELKSKTNCLNTSNKDDFPLQKYIHDELCERLNFLTETLALIRQYDQELKTLIQNIEPNESVPNPPETHDGPSLFDLFCQ